MTMRILEPFVDVRPELDGDFYIGWRYSMGTNRTGLILFLSIDSISSVEL